MTAKTELVLRPGLNRWGWMVGVATFMGSCGGLGLRQGWPLAWPYLGGAAALLGFAGWALFAPRMRLHLSPGGFGYGTARRRYFFHWSDVAGFGVSAFAAHRWVVFRFAPGYRGDEQVRVINREFGGFDRFLPDTYGMRPDQLAELLESWRLRYSVPAQPDAPADGPGTAL